MVNDPEGVARAEVCGLGLARVGGGLVTSQGAFLIQARGPYVIYPSGRYLPRSVTELFNYIAEQFSIRAGLRASV